jgi:DDE superfamily endonuclease
VHRAKAVSAWVGRHAERIELHFLPGYSPELNPVELLNHDVKANAAGRRRPRSADELRGELAARVAPADAVAGVSGTSASTRAYRRGRHHQYGWLPPFTSHRCS